MPYTLNEAYSCDFTGGPMVPKGFAIHWWDDPANVPTFWPVVKLLLARSAARSASVNFVAEAGLVACLVSPTTVAWAQGDGGDGWGNNNLVSIECNPRCSPGDRETVAELMADQHLLNGVPLVAYPHHKFTATRCPGVWEQWIPWLLKRAAELVAAKQGKPVPKPAPAAKPVPKPAPAARKPRVYSDSAIHWVVERGDTLGKIAAYYNGPTVAQIAAHNNIDANTIKPGQKIWIPGRLEWIIEAPDTIRSVAKYYGLDPGGLAARNGLAGPDATIYVGNRLVIQ